MKRHIQLFKLVHDVCRFVLPINPKNELSLPSFSFVSLTITCVLHSLQVRSCDACFAKSPVTSETWGTSPRWPTPRSSRSSFRTDAARRCDGLRDPRGEAPTAASNTTREEEKFHGLGLLSNKQPFAPDEYHRCAAEPVFKMTPLSSYVRTNGSR